MMRWRCADLKRVVRDRFGIDLSEVRFGRILQQLGVEPHTYLVDVITRIVNGHPISQIDDQLPWAILLRKPSGT